VFTGQPQCAAAPRPPGWRERSNSSRECVIASIKRHRVAVFFVLAYAQTWGATPWNGFFAPGVLLAALIVVTLTQGLSGLKAPARNASPAATPSHS
jgi:hypothetical protein